jgi:hypothetical protein
LADTHVHLWNAAIHTKAWSVVLQKTALLLNGWLKTTGPLTGHHGRLESTTAVSTATAECAADHPADIKALGLGFTGHPNHGCQRHDPKHSVEVRLHCLIPRIKVFDGL